MDQVRLIPTEEIFYDERNPRLGHMTENLADPPSQDWYTLALGGQAPDENESGATYSSLKASIRSYGKIFNPIIVRTRLNGGFTVIEGNTRLAIYKELGDEEDEEGKWDKIPARVQDNATERDEHAIRILAHLVGTRAWKPYDKGKYLHDLKVNEHLSISELQEWCGGPGRRKEIENYINAYIDMKKSYIPICHKEGAAPAYNRFSAFVEIQSRKNILARHNFTLNDFARWVFDGKFPRQEDVRQIPRILANVEAKRIFLEHNVPEALKIIDQPNPNAIIGNATIEQLAAELTVKLRQIGYHEVKNMESNLEGSQAVALLNCLDELQTVTRDFGVGRE
jgi:ParB-like nuclease domain